MIGILSCRRDDLGYIYLLLTSYPCYYTFTGLGMIRYGYVDIENLKNLGQEYVIHDNNKINAHMS